MRGSAGIARLAHHRPVQFKDNVAKGGRAIPRQAAVPIDEYRNLIVNALVVEKIMTVQRILWVNGYDCGLHIECAICRLTVVSILCLRITVIGIDGADQSQFNHATSPLQQASNVPIESEVTCGTGIHFGDSLFVDDGRAGHKTYQHASQRRAIYSQVVDCNGNIRQYKATTIYF